MPPRCEATPRHGPIGADGRPSGKARPQNRAAVASPRPSFLRRPRASRAETGRPTDVPGRHRPAPRPATASDVRIITAWSTLGNELAGGGQSQPKRMAAAAAAADDAGGQQHGRFQRIGQCAGEVGGQRTSTPPRSADRARRPPHSGGDSAGRIPSGRPAGLAIVHRPWLHSTGGCYCPGDSTAVFL